LLVLLFPGVLSARKSQNFVSLGAGATELNGGLDWVIAGGPIIAPTSAKGGCSTRRSRGHAIFSPRPSKHDVFATVGYAGMESSEFSSQGATVGGVATFWPATHLGLRLDAFRFLPVATENNIPAEERSESRYWGVRAGVAFRFR
jgi:hypothetical protein